MGPQEGQMARRKHTPEQVMSKLRQAEVAMPWGSTVAEANCKNGVTEQTFYRWRSEYGGCGFVQARRLKQLETENARSRLAIADLTLDNRILNEAAPPGGQTQASGADLEAKEGPKVDERQPKTQHSGALLNGCRPVHEESACEVGQSGASTPRSLSRC